MKYKTGDVESEVILRDDPPSINPIEKKPKKSKKSEKENKFKPEVVPEVIVKKVEEIKKPVFVKKPDYIMVVFTHPRGKGNNRTGRTGIKYNFTGGVPVKVSIPIDIKFFTMKAERNPERWNVI